MRIGIDIDGVLTDIERFQIDYGSKYCFENNIGEITNPNGYRVFELFGNDKALNKQFWNQYREIYGIKEKIRPFAAEIISKLKEDGNEIYIITARYFTNENSKKGEETRNIVKNWLKDNNVVYDKLIFSGEDKVHICSENKIDLMIDDSVDNVNNISTIIPVICFDARYNKECKGKNIIRCYSWYDIYAKIKYTKGGNMNILFKITDKDFGIEPQEMKAYRLRVAARGIVVRDDGKIAIQNKSNKNEFKLVGGGMEENEDPTIAFKREVLEEAGCEIEIIEKLGTTEEYKSLQNLKQISNIFIAKVINDIHKLNLTEKEKSEGAKLLWVEPKEALKLITNCYDKLLPSDYDDVYDTRFVVLRDRKILEYYLQYKKMN